MANSGKNCESPDSVWTEPGLIIFRTIRSLSQYFSGELLLLHRRRETELTSPNGQFFVTLTSDPVKLKKLTGKYVAFGQADLEDEATKRCLVRLDELADGKGGTVVPVWIDDCNTAH